MGHWGNKVFRYSGVANPNANPNALMPIAHAGFDLANHALHLNH